MLIIPGAYVRQISEAIVVATHGLTTTTGDRGPVVTIDPNLLRQVAITAVALAVGQTVIGDDEKIAIRRSDAIAGPFILQQV